MLFSGPTRRAPLVPSRAVLITRHGVVVFLRLRSLRILLPAITAVLRVRR
jgi:hypothetical protein